MSDFAQFVYGDEGPCGSGPYDPQYGGAVEANKPGPTPEPTPTLALGYTEISPARANPYATGVASLWPRYLTPMDRGGRLVDVLIRETRDSRTFRDSTYYNDTTCLITIFDNRGHSRVVAIRSIDRFEPFRTRYKQVGGQTESRRERRERMEDRAYQAMHIPANQVQVVNDRYGLDMWEGPWLVVSMNYRVFCVSPQGVVSFGQQSWSYDHAGVNRLSVRRLESWDGFDLEGWSSDGYDREGFGRAGFNRSGYDRDGFNREGWTRNGVHRDGRHRDDCRCQECDLQGYHAVERDWKLPEEWDQRILFGLENELDTEGREAQRHAVKLLPKRGKTEWFLIAERDGSLGEYGIEFIGPPLPLEYYLSDRPEHAINPWMGFLPKIEAECGAEAPEEDHGMHINISRDPLVKWDFSKRQHWEKRFLDTINSCRKLVQFVAGRRANNWADFKDKGPERYEVNGPKYRVANVKSKVIELRIFRASTNPERMRANVQFCYAVLMWTKRGFRARGSRCDARLIDWVKGHPTKYPDLIKLLAHYTPAGPRDDMPEPPNDYRADWLESSACGLDAGCGACERQRAIRVAMPHLVASPEVVSIHP